MFKIKRRLLLILLLYFFLISFILIFPQDAELQYWAAMPPYNVLWPLFSPVLSPIDPVTGLPTPLVTSLTNQMVLPVQPALVFDPCQPNVEGMGFLVYNTPPAFGSGLTYWDPYYGLNPWPPSYMLDPLTGALLPIALPTGWSVYDVGSLLELKHFEWFDPLGNAAFSLAFGTPYSSLLTTGDIWGNLILPLAALTPPII